MDRSEEQLLNRVQTIMRPRQFLAEGERGMSLIEIIIVVALIGTLMAYMVSNLVGKSDEARKDQAKIAMNMIAQNLQLYRVHNNKYPTTEQGLKAMLENPDGSKGWRGPYTEADKLKDPWQNEFHYESDGRNVKIISGGPDGQFGNDDDIVYPEDTSSADKK